jgi:hypothetical protein
VLLGTVMIQISEYYKVVEYFFKYQSKNGMGVNLLIFLMKNTFIAIGGI